jgi:hypothetical protein
LIDKAQYRTKGAEPSEDAILIRPGKPRIADDIGDQDRGQFAGLAHGDNAEVARSPDRGGLGMVRFHAALMSTRKCTCDTSGGMSS